LPQLGWVEYIKSREIPDGFKVKQVRFVRKASGYFLMMTLECDVNVPLPVPSGNPRGIDLGLDKFAATSDGQLIERPRFLNSLHRKLKLLQRRLKNKKKGSNNRHKLNRKIARLHQRICDARKDWHFKLAHKLCDDAGMIFVEDIDFRVLSVMRIHNASRCGSRTSDPQQRGQRAGTQRGTKCLWRRSDGDWRQSS
jgi:putative transposase